MVAIIQYFILAVFVINLIAPPINAQTLWDIYFENEPVRTIIEIPEGNEEYVFNSLNNDLVPKLKMKESIILYPMFPGALSKSEIFDKYGFEPQYNLDNFYFFDIPFTKLILSEFQSKSPFHFASQLKERYKLISAEPDLPINAYPGVSLLSSSTCPDIKQSPSDRAWSIRKMNVQQAWSYSRQKNAPQKGDGVKIGHPDTGYSEHIDLDKNALKISEDNNFVEKGKLPKDPLKVFSKKAKQIGHGTSTGSVIISRGQILPVSDNQNNGGTGRPGKITGVAPMATLVPYRCIKSVIRFTYGNITQAIYKAVNDDCSVISLSFGGPLKHRSLCAAIEYAIERNAIVVAAAGNIYESVVYPAAFHFCIAVAATNSNDKEWKHSAHGPRVTISAPGESVWRALRTKPNEEIDKVEPSCGTSYSTAHVAGVAALWLAHYNKPKLIKRNCKDTKLQFIFKRILQRTARIPENWDSNEYGDGIVDAQKLLMTNPDLVIQEANKDYEDFKNQKQKTTEENLKNMEQMYLNYLDHSF